MSYPHGIPGIPEAREFMVAQQQAAAQANAGRTNPIPTWDTSEALARAAREREIEERESRERAAAAARRWREEEPRLRARAAALAALLLTPETHTWPAGVFDRFSQDDTGVWSKTNVRASIARDGVMHVTEVIGTPRTVDKAPPSPGLVLGEGDWLRAIRSLERDLKIHAGPNLRRALDAAENRERAKALIRERLSRYHRR